ncbi:MAG: N-6 DNA methylase [Richelia sp. RM2_1_2]|nr:N-6 DNA methylase [Richelia sp. RM2_1_2]
MKTITRKKELGEVFTPPELVEEILDKLPPDIWLDPTKTFIDPSGCGNGNFLIGVKNRLLKHNHTQNNILPRIFGVDIMEDNCVETILRLHFDFPLYNQDNTINEEFNSRLSEESDRVSNNTSEYIKVIRLTNITNYYFKYHGIKENYNSELDDQKVKDLLVGDVEYFNEVKQFLRPGLKALFLNKKTNSIIETVVQADGLLYDYSFGTRKLTPLEIYTIRCKLKKQDKY